VVVGKEMRPHLILTTFVTVGAIPTLATALLAALEVGICARASAASFPDSRTPRVSTRVNNPADDAPECIAPLV